MEPVGRSSWGPHTLAELLSRCYIQDLPRIIAAIEPQIPVSDSVWCCLLSKLHPNEHPSQHAKGTCKQSFFQLASLHRCPQELDGIAARRCTRVFGLDTEPLRAKFYSVPPGRYVSIWRMHVSFSLNEILFYIRSLTPNDTTLDDEIEADLLEITLSQQTRKINVLPPPFVVPLYLRKFSSFEVGFRARNVGGSPVAFVELFDVELIPHSVLDGKINMLDAGREDGGDGVRFKSLAQGDVCWFSTLWTRRRARCSRFDSVVHVTLGKPLHFESSLNDIEPGDFSFGLRFWSLLYPYCCTLHVTLEVVEDGEITFVKSSSVACTLPPAMDNEYYIDTVAIASEPNQVCITVEGSGCLQGLVFDYFCAYPAVAYDRKN